MIPFDMTVPPVRVPSYLQPLILGAAFIMTRPLKLKIRRHGMENITGPFLVLSTHQGFSDYYIAPLALSSYRANYVSDMEGFAAFGKRLYRNLGCIGKRRYVPDITVMQNIGKCFKAGRPVVIFPESRHSNVGTTSLIPKNMGRLAKHFAKRYNTPLVILSCHGCYLANPFWDEEHTRKGRLEADLSLLYTADELLSLDENVIQQSIESALSYDEYAWQEENNIAFKGKNLAEGLHLPLYQCRNCGSKYTMISHDDRIGCKKCRKVWKLSPYGRLYDSDKNTYSIVDWYNWERSCAEHELETRSFNVRIEALPNEYGFVKLGEGRLTLTEDSFKLEFCPPKRYNYTPADWVYSKDGSVTINFPHKTRESLQTEYNYRGRGPAVVLSSQNMCYYLYSDDKDFNPTELQFMTEKLAQGSQHVQA
jgi:ribosomal protein S27AE